MNDKINISSSLFSMNPERWCIQNSDKQYWNGSKFVNQRLKAALYDTIDRANGSVHKILIAAYSGKRTSHKQFYLPIVIDTYGDPNIPEDDIIQYLSNALQLTIDQETYGNGPNGNLVLPSISWKGFKKKEEEDE